MASKLVEIEAVLPKNVVESLDAIGINSTGESSFWLPECWSYEKEQKKEYFLGYIRQGRSVRATLTVYVGGTAWTTKYEFSHIEFQTAWKHVMTIDADGTMTMSITFCDGLVAQSIERHPSRSKEWYEKRLVSYASSFYKSIGVRCPNNHLMYWPK